MQVYLVSKPKQMSTMTNKITTHDEDHKNVPKYVNNTNQNNDIEMIETFKAENDERREWGFTLLNIEDDKLATMYAIAEETYIDNIMEDMYSTYC